MADVSTLAEEIQQQQNDLNSFSERSINGNDYFDQLDAFLDEYKGIEDQYKVLDLVKDAIKSLKSSHKRIDIANIYKHLDKNISMLNLDQALNKLCEMKVLNQTMKAGYTAYTFSNKTNQNSPQLNIDRTEVSLHDSIKQLHTDVNSLKQEVINLQDKTYASLREENMYLKTGLVEMRNLINCLIGCGQNNFNTTSHNSLYKPNLMNNNNNSQLNIQINDQLNSNNNTNK